MPAKTRPDRTERTIEPAQALRELDAMKDRFDAPRARRKLVLLRALERARLGTSAQVLRLHEVLCFLRAYPDDRRVLGCVERMLAAFDRRADLRQHRAALADSGVAGTTIWYPFFWPMARWLAARWPMQLRFHREDDVAAANIARDLPLLVTEAEAAWLRATKPDGYSAIDRLRARAVTDATFFVRQVASMPGTSATREVFHDAIEPSYELVPGRGTPSRTRAWFRTGRTAYQTGPLDRLRPNLRAEIVRAPRRVRAASAAEGDRLIDLARAAMVTRERDLDAFAYGDPRDVRLVDDGDGLVFMVNGVVPERRALVPAIYGALTLRNGVPIGYVQLDAVGRTVAISFNTFETYRGGEAAYTFGRMLAMAHHLFGSCSFSIEPYQLGEGNAEGIASGAWWFYYKLGFRPRAAAARRLVKREVQRIERRPEYRSSEATLEQLARWHLFFDLDPARAVGLPPVAALGPRVAADLARRARGDRARALEHARAEVARWTGVRSLAGWSADERAAWARWVPLLASLRAVSRWSADERRALVAIVRAKGGRRESTFVERYTRHARLDRALFGDY